MAAVALCGTEQQLCETEQLHSANTQMAKQISPLSTNHVTYSPRRAALFTQVNNSVHRSLSALIQTGFIVQLTSALEFKHRKSSAKFLGLS